MDPSGGAKKKKKNSKKFISKKKKKKKESRDFQVIKKSLLLCSRRLNPAGENFTSSPTQSPATPLTGVDKFSFACALRVEWLPNYCTCRQLLRSGFFEQCSTRMFSLSRIAGGLQVT